MKKIIVVLDRSRERQSRQFLCHACNVSRLLAIQLRITALNFLTSSRFSGWLSRRGAQRVKSRRITECLSHKYLIYIRRILGLDLGLNYGFNYGLPKTLKCFKEDIIGCQFWKQGMPNFAGMERKSVSRYSDFLHITCTKDMKAYSWNVGTHTFQLYNFWRHGSEIHPLNLVLLQGTK